jgi:uncharacterized repeat protein (TIGR01451 family)
MRLSLLVVLTSIGLTALSQAQGPPVVPPPGKLYIKFQAEAGARVSYLAAPNTWKVVAEASPLTLQPGMKYLFKVEGLPGSEKQPLYPTLEVLDVLYLPPHLKASDHPAPINLTEADALAVRNGMVTKVVTLEDPEGPYVGIGGDVNGADVEPLAGLECFGFAREVGRTLAILRLGNKEPSPEALQGMAGPSGLAGMPNCGTMVPLKPFKLGEECLRDGGDLGRPVHYDTQGKLKGLEPADSVMTFTDSTGHKHILPTNPTCLCVPRFVSLRTITPLAGIGQEQHVSRLHYEEAGELLGRNVRPEPIRYLDKAIISKTKARVAIDIGTDRVVSLYSREGVRILGRIEASKQVIGEEIPPEQCEEGPLELCKICSTDKAQLGDIVTYTIKYANKTCQPILDVAIVDSLTARLEYIPGSQKSTRESIFVTQKNEVGAQILRWEIKDAVPAKQAGEVSFQVRVK